MGLHWRAAYLCVRLELGTVYSDVRMGLMLVYRCNHRSGLGDVGLSRCLLTTSRRLLCCRTPNPSLPLSLQGCSVPVLYSVVTLCPREVFAPCPYGHCGGTTYEDACDCPARGHAPVASDRECRRWCAAGEKKMRVQCHSSHLHSALMAHTPLLRWAKRGGAFTQPDPATALILPFLYF